MSTSRNTNHGDYCTFDAAGLAEEVVGSIREHHRGSVSTSVAEKAAA